MGPPLSRPPAKSAWTGDLPSTKLRHPTHRQLTPNCDPRQVLQVADRGGCRPRKHDRRRVFRAAPRGRPRLPPLLGPLLGSGSRCQHGGRRQQHAAPPRLRHGPSGVHGAAAQERGGPQPRQQHGRQRPACRVPQRALRVHPRRDGALGLGLGARARARARARGSNPNSNTYPNPNQVRLAARGGGRAGQRGGQELP